jgi:DNA repair and recombination RAD54-like protein
MCRIYFELNLTFYPFSQTYRMHAQRFIAEPSCCELLICDEAHRLKNSNSQINRALSGMHI